MGVVVGDQPVNDVLALDLLDVERGQLDRIDAVEVDFSLEIGPPFLDGARLAFSRTVRTSMASGSMSRAIFVGGLLTVGNEVIGGAFRRLEEPTLARLVGPELLAVRAADLDLAGVVETPGLGGLVGPGGIRDLKLAPLLGEGFGDSGPVRAWAWSAPWPGRSR